MLIVLTLRDNNAFGVLWAIIFFKIIMYIGTVIGLTVLLKLYVSSPTAVSDNNCDLKIRCLKCPRSNYKQDEK